MTVNVENMRKWVTALRSGNYAQGVGRLEYQEDGKSLYCCLGVACRVAIADGVVLPERASSDDPVVGILYLHSALDDDSWTGSSLPIPVIKWLGLPGDDWTNNGDVALEDPEGETQGAISANDAAHLRWSFDQIADGLERRYLK